MLWQPGSPVVLISLNSVGASPEDATPNSRHISLLPDELALAWRNKAFGHGTHTTREGKLKIKVYWKFRQKKDDALKVLK